MSSKDEFDDLIRRKFSDEEEEVSPLAWQSIEKQLPVQVKQNMLLRKRYLVLLLFLISVSGYLFLQEGDGINSRSKVVQEKNSISEPSKKMVISSSTGSTNITSDSKTTEVINAKQSGIVRGSSNENKSYATEAHEKAVLNAKHLKLNGIISKSEKRETKISSPEEYINNTLASSFVTNKKAINHDVANAIGITDFEYMPTKYLQDENVNREPIKPNIPLEKMVIDKLNKSSINRLFAEVFYSVDFSRRAMNANKGYENYVLLRANTESYYFSHSSGIRTGYNLNKNFSIKAGYDYTLVHERLSYSYITTPDEAIKAGITVDSTSGALIDPLTNLSTDTVVGNYEADGEIVVNNYYRFHNIPLMINFHAGNNKLKWIVGAGGFINVGLKTKGRIINTDRLSRIDLSDKNTSPYKSTIGMGIGGELLISYNLRKNVTFLAGPHAKYYFRNISKNNAPLKETFFNWGIFTGLRITF